MSPVVESILENFMEELININPITLKRTVGKKSEEVERNRFTHSRALFKENCVRESRDMCRTPTPGKSCIDERQKKQELRNLEKSLQKLRDMEASYYESKSQIKDSNPSYQSLDRSSIMMDRSYMSREGDISKSKSRRKKIFDRTPTRIPN